MDKKKQLCEFCGFEIIPVEHKRNKKYHLKCGQLVAWLKHFRDPAMVASAKETALEGIKMLHDNGLLR